MPKNRKDARFNLTESFAPQPSEIDAVLVNDFGNGLIQLVSVPHSPTTPYGVRIITDENSTSDTQKLHDFAHAQALIITAQEDGSFIPLQKARRHSIPCDLYMKPSYINFYCIDTETHSMNLNGEFTVTDKKAIRHFCDEIDRQTRKEDWLEFPTKSSGMLRLNRQQGIHHIYALDDKIFIDYRGIRIGQTDLAAFVVDNPKQMAQDILEGLTSPSLIHDSAAERELNPA